MVTTRYRCEMLYADITKRTERRYYIPAAGPFEFCVKNWQRRLRSNRRYSKVYLYGPRLN